MEVVLDAYAQPRQDDVPLIAMDEACKELHADLATPLTMKPGVPLRQDDKYERHGTSAVFLFFAPLLGWRRATCSPQRTRLDFAREIKTLLTEDFPDVPRVRLVCDNLNTHSIASLYEAFEPAEAHALARRLEFVHTPRNGSWLNVAEIELAVLSEQCTRRRISDPATLASELSAWTARRNTDRTTATWHFTTADARVKLRSLYPQV
jgi:hypothetical protein